MSRVMAASLVGVDGIAVEVEIRISSQLPRIDVVGLPEAAVRESAARVRAAIGATGFRFPDRRVTVNLAPAELRKTGAGLDLPIAVGILAADGALEPERLARLALIGELALDGRLRPVRGALALCLAARAAGCRRIVVRRLRWLREGQLHGTAQHAADETRLRLVRGRSRTHDATVTHDRDAVADLEDLIEEVADVDHGPALAAQPTDDLVEMAGFVDAQCRCRLVHDDEPGVSCQRTQDLHLLLVGDTQLPDAHPWVELEGGSLVELVEAALARRIEKIPAPPDR